MEQASPGSSEPGHTRCGGRVPAPGFHWRAGCSYFPLHELKKVCEGALIGQDRTDMKLQTTATMNVVKIK